MIPGTYLPPEWTPQASVMLTWPRKSGDFARHYISVEKNFFAIAKEIVRYGNVHINTDGDARLLARQLVKAGIPQNCLKVYGVPNDDSWARDYGPITVFRDGKPVHLDFTFNGWGGKYPSGRDNEVTRRLAGMNALQAPVETIDFVLEGGSIDVDGAGTLMTTESCLLSPKRNPKYDKAGIEALLKEKLGVKRILWLKHGHLEGDDTDGHIDTLARFCDAGTIVYQACDDRNDPQYQELKAMAEELASFQTAEGKPYRLVPLPMPGTIYGEEHRRLPAGYANFLICNRSVLVPVYNDPRDAAAVERIRSCFPDRHILPIDCRALIYQYGSLHCVTMQIPETAPEKA